MQRKELFRMKNVTLKDVAKAAGVSYATVSRALSGSSQIGSETRERVLKLCDEMGYTTNFVARSMVTNMQTGTSTELTKNELRILSLLLSRAGKIVSRSAIMQDLWDSDAFVDDNTLTVNINRLRTTLEKIGIKGYLTTHRGQGYSV